MKRRLLTVVAALIVFGVSSTRNIGRAADRYVVLISVDGLAATYLNDPAPRCRHGEN